MRLERAAMNELEKIIKCKELSLEIRISHTLVFLITMYGYESWTLKKANRGKKDLVEIWCWKRALQILWTARIINKRV